MLDGIGGADLGIGGCRLLIPPDDIPIDIGIGALGIGMGGPVAGKPEGPLGMMGNVGRVNGGGLGRADAGRAAMADIGSPPVVAVEDEDSPSGWDEAEAGVVDEDGAVPSTPPAPC